MQDKKPTFVDAAREDLLWGFGGERPRPWAGSGIEAFAVAFVRMEIATELSLLVLGEASRVTREAVCRVEATKAAAL